MKTNNQQNSFLSSVIVAFLLTLFLSSNASATWSNYSYYSSNDSYSEYGSSNYCYSTDTSNKSQANNTKECERYQELANKHKSLADKYLRKYYNTYCYSYYKLYLSNMNKYAYYKKKFVDCQPVSVDCDKYKTSANQYKKYADSYKEYADKYYKYYKKYDLYCYYTYYQYYINKYNTYIVKYDEYQNKYSTCLEENIYGKVHGVVYEDSNENGQQDSDEQGVAGIVVRITDEQGVEQITKTNALGLYKFPQVNQGVASVEVDETTIPEGTKLVSGLNPSNVTVIAGQDEDAGEDGYTKVLLTGTLCVNIFVDFERIAQVTYYITDSQGHVLSGLFSNLDGSECYDVPVGDTEIVVDDIQNVLHGTTFDSLGNIDRRISHVTADDIITEDFVYVYP